MIKYASNTLLATLVSWSNELANLASALGGIDAMEVVEGLAKSRYLAPPAASPEARGAAPGPAPIAAFLVPGCGFGGSCLPKDTAALIAHGRAAGVPMKVLEAVRDVNLAQPARLLALVERHIPDLKGVPVAVLGLAFRPGTGDLRESPAIPLVRNLLARGAKVSAYDPAVAEEMAERESLSAGPRERPPAVPPVAAAVLFENAVRLCPTLEEAVAGAQVVILVTRWPEFRRLADVLDAAGARPLVVDGRRLLDKRRFGRYEGIGL
jgi:UDPglucose 6-dehydrogenase/GDP-mannose 6-dehydrogenase